MAPGISPCIAETLIPIDTGIVFITGSSSLACGYRLLPNNDSPIPVPVDRSGGWGYLLGDSVMKHPLITSAKPQCKNLLRARGLGLPPIASSDSRTLRLRVGGGGFGINLSAHNQYRPSRPQLPT